MNGACWATSKSSLLDPNVAQGKHRLPRAASRKLRDGAKSGDGDEMQKD
jgi:hypothetical protein